MNTIVAAVSSEPVLPNDYLLSEFHSVGGIPTVIVATADLKVRDALVGILGDRGVNVEWARGIEAAKTRIERDGVAACLCGFGLEDGSYKDLVKVGKRQIPELPVIIVSTPSSANEYGEYLAAMNAGAFDFLCHPYQNREVERILRLAVNSCRRFAR